MNCADIAGLLDDRTFDSLTDAERHDCEAHARTCHRCAQLWVGHARFAAMSIPPLPPEFAKLCEARAIARARSSVLRFVPRTVMLASGFVVLAAAAAVVTVMHVAPVLQRAEAPAPQHESNAVVPPLQIVALPAARPSAPVLLPVQPVHPVVQGKTDMKKSASVAVTIAAIGTAAVAQAQTAPPAGAPQRITAEQIVASNDLNKDGIVTREEATEANKSLITIWNMYDTDKDGRLDIAEIRRATSDVAVGNATQKITGSPGKHKSMEDPLAVIAANDQNSDGIVTREEATQANKALIGLWNTFDLNKDGKVDAAEIAKASAY